MTCEEAARANRFVSLMLLWAGPEQKPFQKNHFSLFKKKKTNDQTIPLNPASALRRLADALFAYITTGESKPVDRRRRETSATAS